MIEIALDNYKKKKKGETTTKSFGSKICSRVRQKLF